MILDDPSGILLQTVSFAAIKHSSQRRKDPEKTPYINHPIGVAVILWEAGVRDLAILQGALLHDTVEDTDTTFEEVSRIVLILAVGIPIWPTSGTHCERVHR